MQTVIMAAGEAKRWNNYLGVPKQLIPIDGEPIIKRAIRLLEERGITDITITVPFLGYFLAYSDCKELVGSDKYEIDKFLNARHIFKDPTLFIWGDTYFTEEAIDTILADQHEFRFFGRKAPGEIFALKANEPVMKAARALGELKKSIRSCGSWHLYRVVCEYPFNEHKVDAHFTEINDLTEDFDSPDEYESWLIKRAGK